MVGAQRDYTYMGGTNAADTARRRSVGLLLEHTIENEGESNPTSALVKAIFTASAHDMTGQYSSSTNGAGETAGNNHELGSSQHDPSHQHLMASRAIRW